MFRVSDVRLSRQQPYSLPGLASVTISVLGYHTLWTSQVNKGRMSGNLAPKAIQFLLKFESYWPVEALLTRYFQARCAEVHLLPMRQCLGTLSHGKGWAITDLQMLPRKVSFIQSEVCFLFSSFFSSFHSQLIFFKQAFSHFKANLWLSVE